MKALVRFYLQGTGEMQQSTKKTEFITRRDIDEDFKFFAQQSYNHLMNKVRLAKPPQEEFRTLLGSIVGHSQQGHVGFHIKTAHKDYRYFYQNSHLHDIVVALDLDAAGIREDTHRQITNFSEYLHNGIDTLAKEGSFAQIPLRWNQKNLIEKTTGIEDFFSAEEFKQYLAGVYLGSVMDSSKHRLDSQKRSGLRMHLGSTAAIDLDGLASQHLSLSHLTSGGYKNRLGLKKEAPEAYYLDQLIRRGVIREPEGMYDLIPFSDDMRFEYIEFARGSGTSDDAAMIVAGLLKGKPALFGVDGIDQVDTLEKYSQYSINGGFDERIGEEIKQYYEGVLGQEFPVSRDDINALIYSSSKLENNNKKPSSSQRYFYQVKNGSAKMRRAIESHICFIDHFCGQKDLPRWQEISFDRMPNRKVYDSIVSSLKSAVKKGFLSDDYDVLSTDIRKRNLNPSQSVFSSRAA